jgi:hypothetical protein
MLGGFLGAGKTTTIARLARHYQAEGRTVAVVTNDKADDLVDTLNLRAQGLHVGELPGVCFCGNVDELLGMVDALGMAARPEIVIAEPVGSCLDVSATVLRPLEAALGSKVSVAPYGVIVKPVHAAKILRGEENAGVSPKAAYLFRKQLEEADFAVVNRADQLSPEQIDEILGLLHAQYPEVRTLAMSARTGAGFDGLVAELQRPAGAARRAIEIDYAAYHAGEAELGWLNGNILVNAALPLALDGFLLAALRGIRTRLQTLGAEASHVKLIGLHAGKFAVANLVSTTLEPELSQASGCATPTLQLIINARVGCAPQELRGAVDAGLAEAAALHGATLDVVEVQCFRPA